MGMDDMSATPRTNQMHIPSDPIGYGLSSLYRLNVTAIFTAAGVTKPASNARLLWARTGHENAVEQIRCENGKAYRVEVNECGPDGEDLAPPMAMILIHYSGSWRAIRDRDDESVVAYLGGQAAALALA